MKKVILSFVLLIACLPFSFAQGSDLLVKSSDKGLYLDHKVAAKENFYSVGRLYNIPPKEIAAYNKLDMAKGLNLGQMIRIPLSTANFSQTINEGTPVYYKVKENEGLLTVSNANNKVLIESLRKWNNLSSDKITVGNKLIIGFLSSSEMPVVKIAEKKIPVVDKPVVKTETEKPPVEKTITKAETEKPVVDKPVVKTESEKPVVEKPVAKMETEKPVIKAEINGQGYFKNSFDQQTKAIAPSKNETVTAGIFKTTSGWTDAKYYALIDGVQSGTVIKIANPSNNKVVYAKVLGEMSGIRQNEGYNLRISSAAASALQISEQDKFVVQVNY